MIVFTVGHPTSDGDYRTYYNENYPRSKPIDKALINKLIGKNLIWLFMMLLILRFCTV